MLTEKYQSLINMANQLESPVWIVTKKTEF